MDHHDNNLIDGVGQQDLARLYARNETPLEESIATFQNKGQCSQSGGHHIAYAYDNTRRHKLQVAVLVHSSIDGFANLYGQIGQRAIIAEFLKRIARKIDERLAERRFQGKSQMEICCTIR